VPDWLAVLIACATPALAFLGALTANRHTRTNAVEAEGRERRRQNLDTLFKAIEWSSSANERLSAVGVAVLDALDSSGVLEKADQPLLDGAYLALVADPLEAYDAAINPRVVQGGQVLDGGILEPGDLGAA
jgi:hypothetical protein